MTNDNLVKENALLKKRLLVANYFYKELLKNIDVSLKDKPLCKNCEFCHIEPVGYVSNRSWCRLSGDDGFAIGINPWKGRPHKRCPLMKLLNAGYRKIPNLKGIREQIEKIVDDNGIILVEDGSVDTDECKELGFRPLVYRKGAALPMILKGDKT